MPRLIEMRPSLDATHYWALVRFNVRHWRLIQYPFTSPPRIETDLYRPGQRYQSHVRAYAALEELTPLQHRVTRTRDGQWLSIVNVADDRFALYLGDDFVYPQETCRLVRVCSTWKMALRAEEQYK